MQNLYGLIVIVVELNWISKAVFQTNHKGHYDEKIIRNRGFIGCYGTVRLCNDTFRN
ncbi:hypothetical protein [Snodgrassella gandavensis]|uniref:hypothetical protein n=1 Tax=Snodgrassella gandavensis TaxID=2946698 RepID=UPI001EF60524|nr:hypothetical protein [Snodgrassella gandavensis]